MTTWWNKNIPGQRLGEFESWLKDGYQSDRIYCRKHIAEQEYKTFLDCGCGIAVEYFGFKDDAYPIEYTGLDSCTYLIDINRSKGIEIIDAELDSPLPIKDDAYDCVYAREIMEHLQYHRRTLDELIRVAKKEVIVTWFIRPDNEPEDIRYREDEDLFHNKYNLNKLEKFILSNDKVEGLSWHEPNEKHAVLHIKMKPYQPRLSIEERDRLIENERLSTFTNKEIEKWYDASEEEITAERAKWFVLSKEERIEKVKQAKIRQAEEDKLADEAAQAEHDKLVKEAADAEEATNQDEKMEENKSDE